MGSAVGHWGRDAAICWHAAPVGHGPLANSTGIASDFVTIASSRLYQSKSVLSATGQSIDLASVSVIY